MILRSSSESALSQSLETESGCRFLDKIGQAQDLGFFSGKQSHLQSSPTTHSPVPGDCIFRVLSEKGDRVLFERLSTPKPASKVTLKSNWLVQQQQPIRNEYETGLEKSEAIQPGTGNSSGKPVQDPEPKSWIKAWLWHWSPNTRSFSRRNLARWSKTTST